MLQASIVRCASCAAPLGKVAHGDVVMGQALEPQGDALMAESEALSTRIAGGERQLIPQALETFGEVGG